MNIILVTDIFGITAELLKLNDKLNANIIVDPYQGKSMGFNNEADAYYYFSHNIGFERYVLELSKTLASVDSQTTLIGFSVGAAAIWRLSSSNKHNFIKQAFCFYGSQIRNFRQQIEPCFTVHLIFPSSEAHFAVSELIAELETKTNVVITQVEYLHGFMNPHSSHFNHAGYINYIALLRAAIE